MRPVWSMHCTCVYALECIAAMRLGNREPHSSKNTCTQTQTSNEMKMLTNFFHVGENIYELIES